MTLTEIAQAPVGYASDGEVHPVTDQWGYGGDSIPCSHEGMRESAHGNPCAVQSASGVAARAQASYCSPPLNLGHAQVKGEVKEGLGIAMEQGAQGRRAEIGGK